MRFLPLVLLTVLLPSASPAATPLHVRQLQFPLPLLVRGDVAEVGYDTRDVPSAMGSLYVRNDLQHGFTRVLLTRRKALRQLEPNDSLKVLRGTVPPRLVRGRELVYYAVVRDQRSGRTFRLPRQSAWVLDKPAVVHLGVHRFGRLRAPEAVVARAGPGEIGIEDPRAGGSLYGPGSFQIGPDRSVWLLDEFKNRLLVWRAGRPDTIDRTVPLPFFCEEFALGPGGTVYVLRPRNLQPLWLYRLDAAGGTRWQSTLDTNGFPTQLRTGPGGTLYFTASYESSGRPVRGRRWTPVATPAGRPESVREQRRKSLWGYQPLVGGLRLVTAFLPFHEERFALIDRGRRVVRAWRVTSRTKIGPTLDATPDLVQGDPVVVVEVVAGSGRDFMWEYEVLRLTPKGTGVRFALSHRPPLGAWGDVVTDLRVGPDGKLYQLGTSQTAGVRISRFSLRR
jgi:hypothetical protein